MNNWDKYFLDVCNIVASNSKCVSRKIGAIIVRDKSIISTGYNGSPRGVPQCTARFFLDNKLKEAVADWHVKTGKPIDRLECPRKLLGYKSGEGLEWCIAGHGERNALINAAREGIITKGATMYMNCSIPCTPCLIEIINAGIEEIVVTKLEYYDLMSQYLVEQSKLKVREYCIEKE